MPIAHLRNAVTVIFAKHGIAACSMEVTNLEDNFMLLCGLFLIFIHTLWWQRGCACDVTMVKAVNVSIDNRRERQRDESWAAISYWCLPIDSVPLLAPTIHDWLIALKREECPWGRVAKASEKPLQPRRHSSNACNFTVASFREILVASVHCRLICSCY